MNSPSERCVSTWHKKLREHVTEPVGSTADSAKIWRTVLPLKGFSQFPLTVFGKALRRTVFLG